MFSPGTYTYTYTCTCTCTWPQVAEPTTGGEGVLAVYEALKERIEAAQGAAMEQGGAPEEPAAPF